MTVGIGFLDGFRPHAQYERLNVALVRAFLNSEETVLAPLAPPRVHDQLQKFRSKVIKRGTVIVEERWGIGIGRRLPSTWAAEHDETLVLLPNRLSLPNGNRNRNAPRYPSACTLPTRMRRSLDRLSWWLGTRAIMELYVLWWWAEAWFMSVSGCYLGQDPRRGSLAWCRSRYPNGKPARPCTVPFEADSVGQNTRRPPRSGPLSKFAVAVAARPWIAGFVDQAERTNAGLSGWFSIAVQI